MPAAMIIAVGSMRRPKLNAVWEAASAFWPLISPDEPFEVLGVDVSSGVGHTPLTREDLMSGARSRVERLIQKAQAEKQPWRFLVGLEGGFDVVRRDKDRLVFLESWAYVSDGQRGSFGSGGSILIPEPIAKAVVDDGVELGHVIDRFAGKKELRDHEGAWGILTLNLIRRQDSFRTAVINAFAPFYNAGAYRPASRGDPGRRPD